MATAPNSSTPNQNTSLPRESGQLLNSFRDLARSSQQAARLTTKLSESLDKASNKYVENAAKQMKALAETSSFLDKALKDEVARGKGRAKDLEGVVKHMEKAGDMFLDKAKAYRDNQAKLNEQIIATRKLNMQDATVRRTLADLLLKQRVSTRQFNVEVERIIPSIKNAASNLDSLTDEVLKNKDSYASMTKTLNTAGAKISKGFDNSLSSLNGSISNFVTRFASASMAWDAASKIYTDGTRLASKGLLGSMATLNFSAVKLRMSLTEMEELVSANRSVIAVLGGGTKGIEEFTKRLDNATAGLEYLGKDAKKAAAAILGGMTKAGMALNPDAGVSKAYNDNLVDLTKQYGKLSNIFGDSVQDFASYYEQIYKSDSIQAKLNTGDTKGLSLQMKEIATRTENLRLMGLTNEQLLQMNARAEESMKKGQNQQSDEIMKRYYAQMATLQAGQLMGGKDGAAAVKFAQSGEMAKYQGMSAQDKQTYQTRNVELFKSLARTFEDIDNRRSKEGGATSFGGYSAIDLKNRAGSEMDNVLSFGKNALTGQSQGFTGSAEQKQKLLTSANENMLKDANGEYTLTGEAFTKLRVGVEQVTSLLNTTFTDALKVAAASAMLFAGASGLGGIMALLSKIPGAGLVGGAASMIGRGATALLGGPGAMVTGAAAGGYGLGTLAYKAMSSDLQDRIGETMVSMLAPLNLFGAGDAKKSAQAYASQKASTPTVASRPPQATTPSQLRPQSNGGTTESAKIFAQLESQYNLPAGLLDSMWAQESGRGKNMYNEKSGAAGHFQFMPSAQKDYGLKNPNDLAESAAAAAKYMSNNMKKYGGDLDKSLAAYNWGPGNVDRKGMGSMPLETSKYVPEIKARMTGEQFNSQARVISSPGSVQTATVSTPAPTPTQTARQDTPMAELKIHTTLLQQLVAIMGRPLPISQPSRSAAIANG